MDVLIILVVKNKCSSNNVTDKNNYRPIALATVTSKVLESSILQRIDGSVSTTDNQFSFKCS